MTASSPTLRFTAVARSILRSLADRASLLRAVDLAIGTARSRVVLRGAKLSGRVYTGKGILFVNNGKVEIEPGVCLFGGMIPTELVCHRGAAISIGAATELNYGVHIEARHRVSIGRRCKFGSQVHISDAGHDGPKPVVIGDDVWIAHGAIIEAGVTIGDGSVVSAGSVVVSDVPPGSLAIGNPARAVRLEVVARRGEEGGPRA